MTFLAGLYFGCADVSMNSLPNPENYYPPDLTGTTWEQITDFEAAGWSIDRLSNAYHYAQNMETTACLVIYQGKVLYYWGEIERKFDVYSIRKSLLSALYGIHVSEGNIELSSTLGELGINDYPDTLSDVEKTATVRMLLQARSGIYIEAAYESDALKASRPQRHSHDPGKYWYYNNWDSNVLGTIFEQETGKKIHEEFNNLIASPTGMEDYAVSDGSYFYEGASTHPAYLFRMTTLDMARFGLLYLQNGAWNGTQIIPEEWIQESTESYSDAGIDGGYGYMWWVSVDSRHYPTVNVPTGTYSARGYGGNHIVIVPEMDIVIIHRVETEINEPFNKSNFGWLLHLIFDAKND